MHTLTESNFFSFCEILLISSYQYKKRVLSIRNENGRQNIKRSHFLIVAENSKVTKWTRRKFNKNEYFIFDVYVRITGPCGKIERRQRKKCKNCTNSSLPFFVPGKTWRHDFCCSFYSPVNLFSFFFLPYTCFFCFSYKLYKTIWGYQIL